MNEEKLPELSQLRGEGVNFYVEETENTIAQMINTSIVEFAWLLAIIAALFVFFKWVIKKENRPTHFWLWAIAVLASVPIFTNGLFLVADTEFHLMRIDAIFEGLKNGQFPVRMSGIFNMNHALPVNIFYGDLFLYFPAVLRFFGVSLGLAYKFFVFAINLAAVYVVHFAFVRIFQKRTLALVVTLLYITAHFRLASFYMRSAAGEFSAQVLMPLILLAFWRLYAVPKPVFDTKNVIFLGVGIASMVYAHMISTLLTCILLAITALVFYKKTFTLAVLKTFAAGALLALALSAAFWIAFLDYYYNTFTELRALATFYSAFMQTNGSDLLHFFNFFSFGEMAQSNFAITPGFFLLFGFFAAFYVVCFQKTRARVRFAFALSFLILFFSTSLFPWDFVTSFKPFASFAQIQVPWRFLSFAVLVLALLVGFLIEELSIDWQKKAMGGAVLATLFSIGLLYSDYATQYRASIVPDAYVLKNLTGSSDPEKRNSAPQYIPAGTQLDNLSYSLTFHNATGQFAGEKDVNLFLKIDSVQGDDAFVEIPRFHYPYFYAVTQEMQVLKTQTGTNNLMRIMLPRDFNGSIAVYFSPPALWRLGEAISILAAIFLGVFVFKLRKSTVNA